MLVGVVCALLALTACPVYGQLSFQIEGGDTIGSAPVQDIRRILADRVAYRSVVDSLEANLEESREFTEAQRRQILRLEGLRSTDSVTIRSLRDLNGLYVEQNKQNRRDKWRYLAMGGTGGALIALVLALVFGGL